MRADASSVRAGPARPAGLLAARWAAVSVALLVVLAALVGLGFAGSPSRLPEGVTIAGVDVGGLTRAEATKLLQARAARVAGVPVVFTVGEQQFPVKASSLDVEADWRAAADSAADTGEGFGPVRGYRRLQTRFFGAEIVPPVHAYEAALDYKLAGMAREVDRPQVGARLVRRGLQIVVTPGQTGLRLDRDAAADVMVRALARLDRTGPVALPVRLDPVDVTAAELGDAARQARLALSAPVTLTDGATRWRLPRWRIAELLTLPSDGATTLSIGGPGADAWFAKLRKTVERPPTDARVLASNGVVSIVPSKQGIALDVPATAKAILAAATSPPPRSASLVLTPSAPERTTEEVKAMGIERRLSVYSTANAGTADRVTNLRRGIELLNGALVAPGETFSFNARVGERTVERGFRPAPVIIRDEYEEAVGGGVSQVATTVFNAAWEAGVKIVERNPHSLYISRYQLGRDATVNYPDLDLRFLNDTPKWILVAASWDGGGITVSLYGGGPARRVESGEGTMRETSEPRVRRIADPTLEKGTELVVEEGSPGRVTAVTRKVYAADGSVLYDENWVTNYRGEWREIRVGTKPEPKPEPAPVPTPKPAPKPAPPVPPTPTTTTGATTAATTTQP